MCCRLRADNLIDARVAAGAGAAVAINQNPLNITNCTFTTSDSACIDEVASMVHYKCCRCSFFSPWGGGEERRVWVRAAEWEKGAGKPCPPCHRTPFSPP